VANVLPNLSQVSALLSVVIIDVVLAGDNAIVVGMAAAGLPAERRRRVIVAGIASATVLRILFATIAAQLLVIIGLTLAGGVLLLWVAWKMYRDLRASHFAAQAVTAGASVLGHAATLVRERSSGEVLTRIVLADLSMSIDNVLAVAGTARAQIWILVIGLVLSVALMGVASTYIARLLERHFWISWVGLGIVTVVALRMIWDGSAQILVQTSGIAGL
jgi:YjbE family integral membrane protein